MAAKNDSKSFDVAKPGETPADETSRPLIVGNRQLLRDPMVKIDEPAASVPNVPADKKTSSAPKIVPIGVEDADESDAPAVELVPDEADESGLPPAKDSSAAAAPDPATAEKETPAEPEPVLKPDVGEQTAVPALKKKIVPISAPSDVKPAESNDAKKPASDAGTAGSDDSAQSSSADSAVVDAVAGQAADKKKSKDSAEALAKAEALQKLVNSKQYFVPIQETNASKSVRLIIYTVFIVLLLAVAGAYLAVDAGVVDVDIELPLDLIKN